MKQEPTSDLTPQQAELIRKADMHNILQKLKKGRTLSSSDRTLIQASAPPDSFHSTELFTIEELARKTGTDRGTVHRRLRGLHPDGIKRGKYKAWSLERVLEWFAGLKEGKQDNALLKSNKLREEVRKLQIANDVKQGVLVRRADVAGEFAKLFGPVLAQVEQKLVNEYPSAVAGLEPEGARVFGKRVFDMILEAHRLAAEKWSV